MGLLSLPRGRLAKPLGGKTLEDCLLHLDGQRLQNSADFGVSCLPIFKGSSLF